MARVGAADGNLDIKLLAPEVWLHTSWQTVTAWGLVASNCLIVREGDHVVIDPAWGAARPRALLAWIDRELQLPATV